MDRREFLQRATRTGLGAAAGITILANPRSVRSAPANERIIMGVIGIRGRGYKLMMDFAKRPDCELAYLADVDSTLFHTMPPRGYMDQIDPALHGPRVEGVIKAQGKAPQCVQDFRRVLDDPAVDAIVIATPEHWHAIPTVWGCAAGKDVYVEKPPTHNVWEGQQMVAAARKYKRIVQVGTQSRSAPEFMAARKYLEQGKLGRIHMCRVVNMKYAAPFAMAPDSPPPKGFNWDIWNGPRAQRPYNATIHRHWGSFWKYGSGDLGGDGIHQIDLARWLCGVRRPRSVHADGGCLDLPGAAETPDTLVATLRFGSLLMTLEATLYTPYMLKTDMAIRQADMFPYWPQNATRVEIYGSAGVMQVGRHGGGWQVFVRPKDRKPVVPEQAYGRFPDLAHQENFVRCVRSRQTPNADVMEGHLSMALVHYANMSVRLGGEKLRINAANGTIDDNTRAMQLFKSEYREPWVIRTIT